MNRPERRQRHRARRCANLVLLFVREFHLPLSVAGWLMDRGGVPFEVQCRLLNGQIDLP